LNKEVSPYLLPKQTETYKEMLERHDGRVINQLAETQITKTRSRHNVKVSDQFYPF